MQTSSEELKPTQEEPATFEVVDLDQYVTLMMHWHQHQVAKLEHMMEIPPGTEVTGEEGQNPITLEGDVLEAFKYGITVALQTLGKLPFTVEYVADTDSEPEHEKTEA